MPGKYDDPIYHARRVMPFAASTGITLAGTQASASEVIRIPITDYVTIDKARVIAMTGGTAAGPTLLFGKSLAGTGAVSNFGTCAFGTNANNAQITASVTSTTLEPGDALVLSIAAGTAASSPKVNIMVGYKETFPQ